MASGLTNLQVKELQKIEYKKCIEDPIYFMKKYVKIQHVVRGTIPFSLYPFQEETLRKFIKNDFNIILKARQMGISTLVSAYALWLMLFNKDKNILVISIKQETSKELITKVRFANDKLPSWLKCEETENTKLTVKFANGSKIQATSSSTDAARSFALSLLIIDEAAFIESVESIWVSAQPTLASGGKAIVLSTPQGVGNFFHNMWVKAEAGENKFIPTMLPWYLHPERDQAWRDDQTKNAKSPRDASQELDCEFLTSGTGVIDLLILKWYKENIKQEKVEARGMERAIWVWEYPDYNRTYIVSADIARGDGSDFSSYQVLDVETLNQCAEYKGKIDTKTFGKMLVSMATEYNNALLIAENSGIGWATLQEIIDSSYPNTFYSSTDLKYIDVQKRIINKYYAEEKKMVPGFTTTLKTRPLIIANMEQYIRNKEVQIYSSRLLAELETFIWHKGKQIAMEGHNDDAIMAYAIGLYVRDTALRLKSEGVMLTKTLLNATYVPTASNNTPIYSTKTLTSGYDYWNMRMGTGKPNDRENLTWLLR